jgi:AcrR family transcriptional regulator
MNKASGRKRSYVAPRRAEAASHRRKRILDAAAALFGRKGIDAVTIADIGAKAGVAASTVYAVYRSKDGLLRSLMKRSLFGQQFQAAQAVLKGVSDPIQLIRLTAHVSRAIYEAERSDLGLVRHASGFSPALRRLEQEFERLRFNMQADRLKLLFSSGLARDGLTQEEARRILWMYTSRDVHRMLVHEGGWSADRYMSWLSQTLREALVAPARGGARLLPADRRRGR